MDRNTEPLPAKETRQMPDAFKIFTGVSRHYLLFMFILIMKIVFLIFQNLQKTLPTGLVVTEENVSTLL